MNIFRITIFIFFYNSFCLSLYCQSSNSKGQESQDSIIKELKNYIKQTTSYASQKKFDSSNYYAEKAWRLSKKINDKKLNSIVVYSNARALYWQANTKEAKKLLKLNIDTGFSDSLKIRSMQLLGTIYEYEENYTEALRTYIAIEKGIRLKKTLTQNDSIEISTIYTNIGFVHKASRNIKKAHSYFDQALQYTNDPYSQSTILFYRSTLYEGENKIRASINFLLKGLDISVKNNYRVLLPSYYAAISNNYIKLEKGDSAVYYGKIGLKNNTDCHLESLFNNVGKGYILTKNYKNAISHFEKAIDYSSEYQALEIHENMRDAFISMNDFKKAIYHNKKYLFLKKRLDSLQIRQQLIDITEKYDSEKKQLKIEILQSENNHNNFVIRKQKTLLILAIISLLLSIAFLAFIIHSYYKQKKHKNFLYTKNRQLAQKIKNNENSLLYPSKVERSISKTGKLDIDTIKKEKIHSFIKNAIHEEFYLENSISLSSLAKSASTNTTYLSKIINEDYKKTFAVFINELRISHTLKQLEVLPEYRILTIENIAYKSGFSSSSAFYNAFKKFTGLTPSYYIKKKLQHEGDN